MAQRAEIVALVGLRGSGKTSVGRLLAGRLGLPFVDLDQRLPEVAGRPGASAGQLLRELGEARFRELESEALVACLGGAESCVLATGGGVVERDENRQLLGRRCRCLWLAADARTLAARTADDHTERPALTDLDPAAEVALLAERREPLYRALAEARFETTGLSIDEVVDGLCAHLRPDRS